MKRGSVAIGLEVWKFHRRVGSHTSHQACILLKEIGAKGFGIDIFVREYP